MPKKKMDDDYRKNNEYKANLQKTHSGSIERMYLQCMNKDID